MLTSGVNGTWLPSSAKAASTGASLAMALIWLPATPRRRATVPALWLAFLNILLVNIDMIVRCLLATSLVTFLHWCLVHDSTHDLRARALLSHTLFSIAVEGGGGRALAMLWR